MKVSLPLDLTFSCCRLCSMDLAQNAALEFVLRASNTFKQVSASSSKVLVRSSEDVGLASKKVAATTRIELAHIKHDIICHHGKSCTRLLSSGMLCRRCAISCASVMQISSASSILARWCWNSSPNRRLLWCRRDMHRNGLWIRARRW